LGNGCPITARSSDENITNPHILSMFAPRLTKISIKYIIKYLSIGFRLGDSINEERKTGH
jgi:hypothetical protein